MPVNLQVPIDLAAEEEILQHGPEVAVTGVDRVAVRPVDAPGQLAHFRNNELTIGGRRDQRPGPGEIPAHPDLVYAQGDIFLDTR